MEAVNCQLIRSEIEESELDWQPAGETRLHLHNCTDCQRFYEERRKLREMVGSLEAVAAPADFDFKLRARLVNEKRDRFVLGSLRFSFRTAALAGLGLLLVSAFVYRSFLKQPSQLALTPPANSTQVTAAVKEPVKETKATVDVASNPSDKPITSTTDKRSKPNSASFKATVANNRRSATKDFSSSATQVVRREDSVAAAGPAFAIGVPNDSMKLSLDDSSGVSRTVSLPRVSFGSQHMLTGDTTSMVRSSTRNIW